MRERGEEVVAAGESMYGYLVAPVVRAPGGLTVDFFSSSLPFPLNQDAISSKVASSWAWYSAGERFRRAVPNVIDWDYHCWG